MSKGVYQILIGDHFYIGQSTHLVIRKNEHIRLLRNGLHKNCHMQRAYNKYKSFKFEVICELPKSMLDKVEQAYINLYWGSPKLMNQAKIVNLGQRSVGNKFGSYKRSEENKKKISISRIKRGVAVGSKNPNYDHCIYTFKHKNGTVVKCTQSSLKKDYNIMNNNIGKVIQGLRGWHSCSGWSLLEKE